MDVQRACAREYAVDMDMASIGISDRFLGCILGHAIGDAAGAPFEGLPADVVFREFGSIHRLLADDRNVETLYYTDDTEMTISVAEVLIEDGGIDVGRLAAAFGRNYNAGRGYGPGTRAILEAMREGEDWERLAREKFPGGSLGNGAAMRVAPVGLFYHREPEAVLEQARRSALPTHLHPVGIEAAQVMAAGVAHLLRATEFDRTEFFRALLAVAREDDLGYGLRIASRLTPDDSLGTLGHGLEAHRSVPTAIACFAMNPDSYIDTVSAAISLGGDTDTLAAMAGALSGAWLGVSKIPRHLIERLEDGEKGRGYLEGLATGLCGRAV